MKTQMALALVSYLGLITSISGCATGAAKFKPAEVPINEGGFFGRVTITDKGEDVTTHCYVNFTDLQNSRKRYISLDDTGWIFSSAEPGPTYLQGAICTLGGLIKYNVRWTGKGLHFDIPTHGEMAYFGHVSIELNAGSGVGVVLAGLVGGGAAAGAVAGAGSSSVNGASIRSEFDSAVQEYARRYGHGLDGPHFMDATIRPVAR